MKRELRKLMEACHGAQQQEGMNRRGFLKGAAVSGFTLAMSSPILHALFMDKYAQATGTDTIEMGFLQVHGGGGPGILGQLFVAQQPNGGPLASNLVPNRTMLSTGSSPIDTSLGASVYADSVAFTALKAAMSPEAFAATAAWVAQARTLDDSGDDQLSMVHSIVDAGRVGALADILGLQNDDSGLGEKLFFSSPSASRVFVQNGGSLAQVGAFTKNSALNGVGSGLLANLSTSINNLTAASSASRVTSGGQPASYSKILTDSAAEMNKIYANQVDPATLNPSADPLIAKAYGTALPTLTATQLATSTDTTVLMALAAKLLAEDKAGTFAARFGGGDYHGDPQSSTNAYDRNVMTQIGRFLTAMFNKGKRCIVCYTQDGGLSTNPAFNIADQNSSAWKGDRGIFSGMACFGVFPDGNKPNLANYQIGAIELTAGAAVGTHPVGSPTGLVGATVANYLQMAGMSSKIVPTLTRQGFTPALAATLASPANLWNKG